MESNWQLFWQIFNEWILPESLTLIWNIVLYGFLGVVVTVLLMIIAHRVRLFRRAPKYYHYVVKLYIPLIILGTLYASMQMGFVRGVFKILEHQTSMVTDAVFHAVVDSQFETPQEKEAFLREVKLLVLEYKAGSSMIASDLKKLIVENNTGTGFVDEAKNQVATFFIDRYKDEIFCAVLAGAVSIAGEKVGIGESLSWSESVKIVDILMATPASDIELAIQKEISKLATNMLERQYGKYWWGTFLLWFLLVIVLPYTEFWIYNRWIAPRYAAS